MTRRSTEERINALDLATCQYTLSMISKDVPFIVALQSAEKMMKRIKVAGTPGQTVLE